MSQVFPDSVMEHTARWLKTFAAEWHQEVPMRLHGRDVDAGGAPQWHAEFARWMQRHDAPEGAKPNRRNPDGRLRLTRAMRHLRKVAPREYECVYRTLALGLSVEQTTRWLNERAIRGGHAERYQPADTLAIIVSGVDKLCAWF